MPWTVDNPPPCAENWTEDEKYRCVSAANEVLAGEGSEAEAIYACIAAAGKGKEEGKAMNATVESGTISSQSGTISSQSATNGSQVAAIEHTVEDDSPVKMAEGLPKDEADEDMATRVNCGDRRAVKALGQDRVGEYLVLWGSPDQKDLDLEYFTNKTEELTAIFNAVGKVPILYHHAMDNDVKTAVVGLLDIMQADDVGLWVEGQLERANKYRQAISKLLSEQALYWSSGTLPGARKTAPDGYIERWPIVEASMTPTPAEFRMLERPVADIKSAYKAVGLEFPTGEPEDKGAEEARQRVVALEVERLRLVGL